MKAVKITLYLYKPEGIWYLAIKDRLWGAGSRSKKVAYKMGVQQLAEGYVALSDKVKRIRNEL